MPAREHRMRKYLTRALASLTVLHASSLKLLRSPEVPPMCVSRREGESVDDYFARWIGRAQEGCSECLGGLFKVCERALRLRIHRELRHDSGAKKLRWQLRDSDLFQQSVMEAQRDIQHFRGKTQAEFMRWLFQIVAHNCEDLRRYYQVGGRHNPKVELSLNHPKHAERYGNELTANEPAPVEAAIGQEEEE